MPENKNQHFVPKVHFRPFSQGGDGSAVNLYLIHKDRTVLNAPVRGQCSKAYLYGKDGALEKLMGRFETPYGILVSRLTDDTYRLSPSEQWLIRYFILLQSLRTHEQVQRGLARMTEMADFFRMAEEAHGQQWDPNQNPTFERIMTELMLTFNEQLQGRILHDLKVVIIRNRTPVDFVTSDDPAVTTNRWLLQRKGITTFGSNAAGLMLFLPLGPRMLALAYDPAVYNVPAVASGRVEVAKPADVLAFNQHQYMRAAASIYFHRPEDADRVAREFEATKAYRPPRWDSFTVARQESESTTHTRFEIGRASEVAASDAMMFHLKREFPHPPSWPSILRYRSNAHGFTRGRVIVRRSRMKDLDLDDPQIYRRVV